MKTQVARLMVLRKLLNFTDLLAPQAKTHVISSVMMKAMMSGGRPKTVPNVSLMLPLIDPPLRESKLALSAQAPRDEMNWIEWAVGEERRRSVLS